ncbi:MAG: hypothetical protein M3Q39_16920, partial [Actinomycetota bacterium]|nr:hypothetical protein [Actinomycetota bacterium]
MAAAFDEPDDGQVLLDGEDVHAQRTSRSCAAGFDARHIELARCATADLVERVDVVLDFDARHVALRLIAQPAGTFGVR